MSNSHLPDALELICRNQLAIAAAVEEIALWVGQRGSIEVVTRVHEALSTLDSNSKDLELMIVSLRHG